MATGEATVTAGTATAMAGVMATGEGMATTAPALMAKAKVREKGKGTDPSRVKVIDSEAALPTSSDRVRAGAADLCWRSRRVSKPTY